MAATKIFNQTVVRGADWVAHLYRYQNKQLITLNMATGAVGDWTAYFHGKPTIAMLKTVTASDFQKALEDISYIGAGNVLVTGSAGGPYSVEWANELSFAFQDKLIITNTFTPLSTIGVSRIPKDLTGYTAKLQARTAQDPLATLLVSITQASSSDGQIIIDTSTGHVKIYVKSGTTSAWTPTSNKLGWYDLYMISADTPPITEAWVSGQLTIEESVIV